MNIGGIGKGLGMLSNLFGGGGGGGGGGRGPLGMVGNLLGSVLGGGGGAGGVLGWVGNLLGGLEKMGGGAGGGAAQPTLFGGLGVGGVRDGFGAGGLQDLLAMQGQQGPQGGAMMAQAVGAMPLRRDLFQTRFDAAPAPAPPTRGNAATTEVLARAARTAGVPVEWANSAALHRLIQKESGGRVEAKNPNSTAFGIFQFLKGTWKEHLPEVPYGTKDAHWQSVGGLRYIQQRYGTPEAALRFHERNNWY